jgi:hypothetical protein
VTLLRVSQMARLALVASSLGTTACVPDFDTDLSQLSEPRLLAIASSPAETQAQKPVKLSALVAVPDGQETPQIEWTMCLSRKPLTELGPVSPSCLEPDDGTGKVLDLGTGASVEATLDKDACKLFGPQRPSPLGSEGAGRPVDPDVTGGFYQPFAARFGEAISLGAVRIDCDLANVDRDDAIAYRERYRVNENPQLAAVLRVSDAGFEAWSDREPLVLRPRQRLPLRATWNECSTESTCGDGLCTAHEDQASCAEDCSGELRGCTGSEPYVWFNRETKRVEDRREAITVAWYASRGRFENEQTGLAEPEASSGNFNDNDFIASSEPGPGTLWLVIRDSRGGQSWLIRHFAVTP